MVLSSGGALAPFLSAYKVPLALFPSRVLTENSPSEVATKDLQDTKEYLNHRGTQIRAFRESNKHGGDKGGGEEGNRCRRGDRAWRGKMGGRMREKGGEKRGPKAHSKDSDFGIPYDLGTL